MTKEFIIAIELGSSKMTGIAGQKNLDGSITILAVAKEDSTSCIRKGVVYNIDKTTTALTNLVKKLKNNLKTEIAFDLKIANIARDGQLVQLARQEAQAVIEADPQCSLPQYAPLWSRLRELKKTNINWAAIS